MLAAVHLSPWFTVLIGTLSLGSLGWYWWRLGDSGLPPSRRRVRRLATALMIMTLPLLVAGLSVHDPSVNQHGYLLAWTSVMGLVFLIVLLAVADIVNNARLYREHLTNRIVDSLDTNSRGEQPTDTNNSTSAAGKGFS